MKKVGCRLCVLTRNVTLETWLGGRQAGKASENASDIVAVCQEQMAAVSGIGLQTVQEMQ
jgi:hypothetical protein